MTSYRSIIKDDHRSWNIALEDEGTYEVQVIYRMKYDEKDFAIQVGGQELTFKLFGKAPETAEIEEMFDGNETMDEEETISNFKYGKASVGNMMLKSGTQTVVFKSGKEFEFKTTIEEFHKQDRKYRGLNVDVQAIRFVKQ